MKNKKKPTLTKQEKRDRIKELEVLLHELQKHISEFDANIRIPLANVVHNGFPLSPSFCVKLKTSSGDGWGSYSSQTTMYNMESLAPSVILEAYWNEINSQQRKYERELNSLIA